jgi:hypothetical protein
MELAVVVGAAECVLDDLHNLDALLGDTGRGLADTAVFGVNDGGIVYPGRLDHWCTLHGRELERRIQRRRDAGYSTHFVTWDYDNEGAERQLPIEHRIIGCTSAFVAVAVAHYIGYRHIVLCGAPIDRRGYLVPHIHHGTGLWEFSARNQEWIRRYARRLSWLQQCVRSMSGWSAGFFGLPTAGWLPLHSRRRGSDRAHSSPHEFQSRQNRSPR